MNTLTEHLNGVAASYASFLSTLNGLTNRQAHEPSGLPGWSRAELLTHLARNADANTCMNEAALRNELIPQYPGGQQQREEEIRQGRDSDAVALIEDFRRSHEALVATWDRMNDDTWGRLTLASAGTRPVSDGVWARWQELEIHHVDLDLSYDIADWPPRFVEIALPTAIEGLPYRKRATADSLDCSWLLKPVDSPKSWTVVIRGGALELPQSAGTDTDVVVRGKSAALLAWVLGRRTPEQVSLECDGDPDVAFSLPKRAPFP